MIDDELKELVQGWYRNKAKDEEEPFFKFMCLWICFNAWLEFESGESIDRSMINWIKSPRSDSSGLWAAYEAMLSTDTGTQNIKNLIASCPIGGTRGPALDISNTNDSDNIIEVLYRIRCNLFHGGKAEGNVRDIKLVTYANGVLSKWMAELIARW